MRCVVPSQRPHMSPACCGGCRAHMGLDPDGPQAACGPLHLAGTRPPASWELSAGPRCVPATGGLPQRSAGKDRATAEGLMEPTLGGSLWGSLGGRLLRPFEPSQVLPGAGTQVTGHSLGERQAPPGRAGCQIGPRGVQPCCFVG